MQIRQQYNADIMNELGITGEKQSDFEQKIRKIKMDTDDALGHRQEKMHIDLCGLSFTCRCPCTAQSKFCANSRTRITRSCMKNTGRT